MSAVYTAENLSKYLKESNQDIYGRRTWAEAFGGINLNAQKAIEGLSADYGQQFGQAYATAKSNESIIAGSNLGEGYKNAAIAENEAALEAAYDAYLQKYVSDIGTINETTGKQLSAVRDELIGQSDKTAAYINHQLGYLDALLNKYEAGEITSDVFNRFDYQEYFDVQTDDVGNIITDETGKPMLSPKSVDALRGEFFDERGQMTTKGWRFFQQVAGDQELRNIYSYETYLQEKDPDLYEWATSFNPYDATANAAGQNLNYASANKLLNVDEVYTEAERLIGADSGTIEKQFDSVYSILTKLETAYNDDDEDGVNEYTEKYNAEMSKLVKDFGLEDDFIKQLNDMGYNVNSVEEAMNRIAGDLAIEESAIAAKEDNSAGGGAFVGGLTGWGIGYLGAAIAMASNPVGWVVAAVAAGGALIGATVGYFAGGTESAAGTEEARDNAQAAAKNRYTELVDALVTMSKNKTLEADKAFYKDLENRPESVDTRYNSNIKRGVDGTTYEYNVDGKAATYLSSAVLNSTVEDDDGDNFEIEWRGKTYDLEVTDESEKTVLDSKTHEKLSRYVYESTGRALRSGDVFYYNNKLWVVTGEEGPGRIRQVQNQFWDSDYNDLMTILNPNWSKVSTWN